MLTLERDSGAPPFRAPRLWALPLWAHVLAYAALLLVVVPLAHVDLPFTTDEGLYGLQAESLRDGQWERPYRMADVDPEGRWFPYRNAEVVGDRYYPLAKRPFYSTLLEATTSVAGDVYGLVLLSLLGAVVTAAAAWLIAAEVSPELSRRAFWLAGLGPVAIQSSLVWAHALSAALAGLAFLAALRVARRPASTAALAALAAACGLGVLVRAEGLLIAVAVAIPLGVIVASRRGLVRGAAVAAVAVGAAGTALLVEARWIAAIHDGLPTVALARTSERTGYLAGRITGAWHSLLQGAYDEPLASLVLAAMVVVIVLAARAARESERASAAPALLGVAAALLFARTAMAPAEPVPGLLAAWPVGLLGLLLVRRLSSEQAVLAAGAVLFTAAVLVTQYPQGGGLEWGGRFFAPLLAPLAVLAAAGLVRPEREATLGRRMAVPVLVLFLLPLVLGVNAVRDGRAYGDRVVDDVVSHSTEVVVTDVDALPLFAWRHDAAHRWLLVPAAERADALDALHRRGVSELTLVVAASGRTDTGLYSDVSDVTTPPVARAGLRMLVLRDPA